MSDADFLHTLTAAESDALEQMGEPGAFPAGTVIFEQGKPDCVLPVRGFLTDNPRAAMSLPELISRRLREAEARQISR